MIFIYFLFIYIFYRQKLENIIFYIIGSLFCIFINIILKVWIKQPNLKEDKVLFDMLIKNNKNVDIDKYGMPSGYSQFFSFTLTYLFLDREKKNYLLLNKTWQRHMCDH